MSLRFRFLWPVLVAGAVLGRPCLAQDTTSGRVVGVTDGDTFSVLRDGVAVTIRLHGIDTPEPGQAFGSAADHFTSKKVFGQTVTVRVTDKDRYGRTVGIVTTDSRESVDLASVRNGYAWWYHQYATGDKELAEAGERPS